MAACLTFNVPFADVGRQISHVHPGFPILQKIVLGKVCKKKGQQKTTENWEGKEKIILMENLAENCA